MIEKLKWAFRLLTAKVYVVATDKAATVYMPYVNPYNFDTMLMLSSQRIAISQVIKDLEAILKEHDDAVAKMKKDSK